ncbi:hypothetical protein [Nocardia nepalensis]|uniref:hypothetical protein n=1 Tax=Nocardia nepalensis TaxID=3375448 RepID=UPI003B67C37B
MLAIDRVGRFFTMDHALSAPREWNWSTRYGTPLWPGPGNGVHVQDVVLSENVRRPGDM